jgi:SAM-dependent methyltransferase
VRLDDLELVRRQYETESGLAVRREAIASFLDGPNAADVALEAAAEGRPERVLEVGCGMGQFGERLAVKLGLAVVAVDLSPRMVELARARGLEARVGDVRALPFADGKFDCAIANWMLYHVPDLDSALSELARVLRPGGRLVAATLREENMADLWRLVDFTPPPRPFSGENGEEPLRRHFRRVERRDVDAALVFPDRTSVQRYVDSSFFRPEISKPVPELSGPLRVRTFQVVFVAER